MPAQRAAATFEPISPDLDLAALVEQTPNFQYVDRIPCDMIDTQGLEAFEKLVLLHVILGGKPLVVDGYHNRLNQWTFSTQWLRDNQGTKFEQARALEKGENLPLSINHYLDNMPLLAQQWNHYNYKEKNRQRLYLKDIDCPSLWHEKLKEVIPPELYYLNDSTGDKGGPGYLDERLPHGIGTRKGRGIARSGDLMSSLPSQMRAENLMCYIGHEGTYTPAHREMCASLGQNIMVEASTAMPEDGKTSKPGSSIWFMTETKDRHLVSEYWLSSLGHDIEVEAHFAQINAWKQAPFTVYIVEQKVGDFLLIPPLAPHQVWNRGTRTMKVAWNRTTVETLELALNEALPRARMVCRDEQYKNKAIILFSLNRYSALLKRVEYQKQAARDEKTVKELSSGHKIKQLRRDFKRLFNLFHDVLLSECLNPQMLEKKVEYIPYDSFVTCSYCRCNIFNRFLTCKNCLVRLEDGDEDTYDICMDCYAMGRSCACLSKLTWVEQFPWKDLLEKHELWRQQIIKMDGKISTKTPLALNDARNKLPKKTLAHICQEQLRARPFKDPNKPVNEEESESESDGVNDDGTVKKKPQKKRSEKWLKEHVPCHICMHREIRWKLAVCSCSTAYCYGSLWRAFDIMPQTVMEDPEWKCPKCRKICNCSSCRKNLGQTPYEPSGTVLGHDTKKFADPRSVESLVDFSFSNMHWLKKAGDDHPTDSRRIEKKRSEAALAKSQGTHLSEHYMDDDSLNAEQGEFPIDPKLGGESNSKHMKQAAMALHAMDNLTQLEQDPESFVTQAGLTQGRFVRNGIDYEYPDPDAATQFFTATQQAEDDGEIRKAKAKKKKKPNDHLQKVQSNAEAFTDDANKRFYLQQSQKKLAEAKKSGRFIMAKAAILGESLTVKLKIDPYRLASMGPHSLVVPAAEQTQAAAPVLVQSDLPNHVPASIAAQRSPHVPKKRQRGEVDEDFVTKKRIVDNQPEDNVSISSTDVDDIRDNSSDGEYGSGQRRQSQNGVPPKRRSLPAYLARKSPVEDDELPKELSNEVRRKTAQLKPSQGKKHSRPNLDSTKSTPTPKAVPVPQAAPVAPMATIMSSGQSSSNDLDDIGMEEPDIEMPGLSGDSPKVVEQAQPVQQLADAVESTILPESSGKASPQQSSSQSPRGVPDHQVTTVLPRRPSEDNLSDESSEFEAPPKPATPSESERSTPTPTPSASPEPFTPTISSKPSKPSKALDKATLNRLAKQRAAAGKMISSDDDFDSDESSSANSLVAKSRQTPAAAPPLKHGSTRGSAARGRGRPGRPRKSGSPSRSEVRRVETPKSDRKSIATRASRGKVKIVSSRNAS